MRVIQTIRHASGSSNAPLDMHEWRERLLSAMLVVALVMGTVAAIPSVMVAVREARHAMAAVDLLSLGWVLFVWRRRSLSFIFRAASLLVVLYLVGAMLLLTIGPMSQIYLLAFPVMTALLLGMRPALWALALNGVTMSLAGYLGHVDFQLHGFHGEAWQKWAIITANFMFIDTLVTVSCSALLKGLERSLSQQRVIARSLIEGRAELRDAHEELSLVTSQLPGMVYRLEILPDRRRRYTFISPGVRSLFGIDPEAVLADYLLLGRFVHPDDRDRLREQQRNIQTSSQNLSMEFRIILADGALKWLRVTYTQHANADGSVIRNGVVMDVTEHKLAEHAVRENEARWKLALESTGDGVWDLHSRDGTLVMSSRLRTMCGYASDDGPEPLDELDRLVHPEDLAPMKARQQSHIEGHTPTYVSEHRLRCADGSWKWILTRGMVISRDAKGQPVRVIGTHTDITGRKQSEALIWQQANYDSLTGLPNRQMLRDRLAQDIGRCQREGLSVAVMFIDLDHFKEVNDTLGHAHGDLLLVEAAHRIRQCVRDSDTLARLGGDEFTVILPGQNAQDRTAQIAQDIIDAMQAVFQLGHERAYVSASVGITVYPQDATDIDELFKQADQALYAAKDAGRNRFSYYTGALQEAAQMRVGLANDLRDALAADQFKVYYQPIVDFRTGEVYKAEALIRWQHPTRGLVSPALFIPIAEACGLISEIGDWVFRQAAQQACRWRERQHPDFQISVNKSPQQFRSADHHQAAWFQHLRDLGLPPQSMVLEITEGLLMDANSGVGTQLAELRQGGMQVSLDDFGTGYSSLSYLQKFDIDFLKIDQAFVRGLTPTSRNLPLCKAIIVMAHELGMQVIAEGVETAEQRDLLKAAGCDYAQGYHYARPMPAEDFEAWFAARAPALIRETSAR